MAVTLMLFVKVLTVHTSARVKQALKVMDITAKVTRSFLFHRSYLESKLSRRIQEIDRAVIVMQNGMIVD